MRLVSVKDRLALVRPSGLVDVAAASGGRFGPDPQGVYEDWDRFRDWGAGVSDGPLVDGTAPGQGLEPGPVPLDAPVPRPRQVFAIGLNYRKHAAETGSAIPTSPPTFTKFPTCLTGPHATVELPSDTVDWEVELVVVIGHRAERVALEKAWSVVAGLTVGQDLSERTLQLQGPVPQFSLGKSFPGFGPIGPAVVTVDELTDPDDLELGCSIDGETVQSGRTSQLVFGVPELVARLSAVCPLLPGDIIFTGTPDGVGMGRDPKRYLAAGNVLDSWITGVGALRTTLVARPATA